LAVNFDRTVDYFGVAYWTNLVWNVVGSISHNTGSKNEKKIIRRNDKKVNKKYKNIIIIRKSNHKDK